MIEHGVIKKGGEVVGYRTPKSELFIEQQRQKVEERKSNREMLKLADHALEAWARWRLTSIGYGNSPLASQDMPKMPAGSMPPIGCREAPEIVLAVIRAFEKMKSTHIGKRYVYVLSESYLKRQSKESMTSVIMRLKLGVSIRYIRQGKIFFIKHLILQ
ncbi:hypothetical protein [Wohlfahrtiimonas sp. G9077]|uniref:hypothetical protein n=1 Tax=Wohlfahrtiimonas sp. G9077 TaxID=1980118 RepID=UPI000B986A34|nr:hypothetical protein [Wohlfahrtiimonas sp. G9077]OYQ75515.1 hypothetical protein B9T20_02100 [Wohlfahrtiimonas sp. G9077]